MILRPVKPLAQPEPLTETELDRLGEFLKSCKAGKAMNIEQLDGFFSALIAGPDPVMPSEYNREVFGGEMGETCEFKNIEEANEILGLLMRHWNTIAATLYKDEVYVPLLQDENGVAHGNDWARGFMRGTVRATTAGLSLLTMRSATDLILTMMLCQSTTKNRRCAPIRSAQRARKSHRAHGGWAFGRLSVFFGRIGRSVPVPTRVNHGTMFPRLEGTLPARAAPGRSTSSAAAGRP